eukprot:GHVU01097398.1.p1 GENE.GHVU01097398.1~~GHVU01097398.1.p1  ORF type:complete len:108 (-),score=4.56 GHVU01097398.1:199-522(-)
MSERFEYEHGVLRNSSLYRDSPPFGTYNSISSTCLRYRTASRVGDAASLADDTKSDSAFSSGTCTIAPAHSDCSPMLAPIRSDASKRQPQEACPYVLPLEAVALKMV